MTSSGRASLHRFLVLPESFSPLLHELGFIAGKVISICAIGCSRSGFGERLDDACDIVLATEGEEYPKSLERFLLSPMIDNGG